MKSKVLLVASNFEHVVSGNVQGELTVENSEKTYYPLGLAYLHSYLESKGINVETLSLNYESYENCLRIVINKIKTFSPDIIGLNLLTSNRVSSYQLIENIHEKYPNLQIVLGGIHATIMYKQLIEKYPFVIVVLGEGEKIFEELIGELNKKKPDLKKIDGLAFYKNGVERTPPREVIQDLDILPFPKHELFFKNKKRRSASLLSSRGCFFSCIEENQRIWFSRKPNNKINTAKVGDKIISMNETSKKLEESEIKKIRTQEKEIFEIELENGDKLKLTNDHKVYTKRGWLQVKDLIKKDEILDFNFREKISFHKKLINPMKDKEVVKKMIKSSRERGVPKVASERMKRRHRNREIEYNSPKQFIARHQSRNRKEENGMWKKNRKNRNFYDLKTLVLKNKIKECSLCNSKKHLCIHHIDGNQNNDRLSNLLVVCKSCHSKIHNLGWWLNK